MTERLGAVAYRHLAARAVAEGTGDGDSLENIVTTPLNDGCLCYVVAEKAYYLLDRKSTAAPVPGFIVKPISGPGRWILVFFGSFATEFSADVFLNPVGAFPFTPTPGSPAPLVTPTGPLIWTPGPPAPPSVYTAHVSAVFEQVGTSGVLKYTGPIRTYRLDVEASLGLTTSDTMQVMITADLNGDRIGTSTNEGSETAEIAFSAFNMLSLSASRIVTLAPNDLIQAVLTDSVPDSTPTTTEALAVFRLHLAATPFE